MKSVLLSLMLVLPFSSFADDSGVQKPLINYLLCSYKNKSSVEKTPLRSVAYVIKEAADGGYYTKSLTVSLAYSNQAGKRVVENAVLKSFQITQAESGEYSAVFVGKTKSGKSLVLEVGDALETGTPSSVTVEGVVQSYPSQLSCAFGAAG